MTDDRPYTPSGGLDGKLRRFHARAAARRTHTVRPSRGIVSFSFDDFPKSAATVGAAELERLGARGTYYASASFAGGENHHGPMFDSGDISRLEAAGHEIGNHSLSHLDCSRAAASAVVEDVERNARALRDLGCAGPLRSFAFPYGEASPAAKRALAPMFDTLRGVRPGLISGPSDFNLLPAHSLDGGDSGLLRVMAALNRAARESAWLIVFTHDVQDSPTPWGCTPSMLRQAAEAAWALDLDILTVGEASAQLAARRAA
jgi:peptidoglycan/xylan/chitin deacetylase (PgdA/CDA1 family)